MMQQKCMEEGKTLVTMIKNYENLMVMKQHATYVATNVQQGGGRRHVLMRIRETGCIFSFCATGSCDLY
jgi:hypothetical protein